MTTKPRAKRTYHPKPAPSADSTAAATATPTTPVADSPENPALKPAPDTVPADPAEYFKAVARPHTALATIGDIVNVLDHFGVRF